jgi:hypothetical protein
MKIKRLKKLLLMKHLKVRMKLQQMMQMLEKKVNRDRNRVARMMKKPLLVSVSKQLIKT